MEIDTSDETFEKDVIEQSNSKPVLVDFWASWCGPCVMLKPVLEKIASSDEFKDKFVLAKLNVEESKETASKYDIMSIPSVKLFKKGKVVDEFLGAQPEDKIKDWLGQKI